MEALIQNLAEKTGISTDQAQTAITTVMDHLKDKLPLGLGDKIESFLSGSNAAPSGDGNTSTGGESMFDELKDKISGGLSNLI